VESTGVNTLLALLHPRLHIPWKRIIQVLTYIILIILRTGSSRLLVKRRYSISGEEIGTNM
jgi:hypothetical protein